MVMECESGAGGSKATPPPCHTEMTPLSIVTSVLFPIHVLKQCIVRIVLNMAYLFSRSHFSQILFPCFLHHHCLSILYATNFLAENIFIYLFHKFFPLVLTPAIFGYVEA